MLNHLWLLGVLLRRTRNEHGASAVEYGLLLVGIAALIAAIVFLFGEAVLGLFTDSCESLDNGSIGRMAPDC